MPLLWGERDWLTHFPSARKKEGEETRYDRLAGVRELGAEGKSTSIDEVEKIPVVGGKKEERKYQRSFKRSVCIWGSLSL